MNTSDFRFLLGYALPYRATLAFCALLMVAESGMALAVPWLGGQLAEGLLADAASTVTGKLLLALLGIVRAAGAAQVRQQLSALSRSAEQILADLRIRLYDHLQALPLGFYHQRRQGEILALLTHDVTHL
jgi:ATP-binding cassette, subfamily B, bacterial